MCAVQVKSVRPCGSLAPFHPPSTLLRHTSSSCHSLFLFSPRSSLTEISLIPSFTPSDPHQCLRGHGGGAENPPPRCSAPLLPTIPLCLPTNRPTDQPTNQTQNFLARVQETAAPKKEEEAEDGNLERAAAAAAAAPWIQ